MTRSVFRPYCAVLWKLAFMLSVTTVSAAPAVKELSILWAQWDPANYLQEIGNLFEKETGVKVTAEGMTEESVEVNLARIDMARLARLVDSLERGPGVVKVRKIRIATRNDDPNLVDVTLQVSTWQQKA